MSSGDKIIIKTVGKPSERGDAAELVDWFCRVFGLSGEKSEIEPVLLKEIIQTSMHGDGTTSKVLNQKLKLPRSTVIYHLNRFIYSGLVIRRGRKYYLRSEDMESTLEELQNEIDREFGRMMEFAQRMDSLFEGNSDAGYRKWRERRKE
jgi:predicted transcriptional regulator